MVFCVKLVGIFTDRHCVAQAFVCFSGGGGGEVGLVQLYAYTHVQPISIE